MRFFLFVSSLFLFSCASTYKPLRPDATSFGNTSKVDEITFSYKLGVLREHGNNKYAKREDRKAIRLASIKIVNNSTRPITIGKDVAFYIGNSELPLMEPAILHKELKQGVPIYLLYLLLTPMKFYSDDDEGTPIGLVIGPGVSIGNMAAAGSANKKFLAELNTFNLVNKTIEPGQTVYGIIGTRDIGYNPISLKFIPAL
jgi:hypothetical protein